MEYVPKEIKEEVNVTPIHPLKYLAKVIAILGFWALIFYLVSGAIAAQVAQKLDPALEAKIGQTLIAPIVAEDVRPAEEQRLQSLLNELQQTVRKPQAEIHIIDSEAVNAGVLPGGQMLITTALLDNAESENELAFVLAHELGHHQLRHPSNRLGRSLLWVTMLSVLGLGQQTSIADPTAPLQLLDLQFSRSQELASDRFALAIVANRYGHVGHSLDFFKRLQAQRRGSVTQTAQLEFLATHPFPKNRIKNLERYARQQRWRLDGNATEIELDETR
ncbi:MAG: M48 family metalloprotease [Cyanobacteria bacterium P01_F01_bin.42]